jgi:two-component system, NarL family, nitrate/nitrite response regulator NarL
MMTKTSVCLVGKEEVFKEGVRSLLEKNGFDIAGDWTDPAGLSGVPEKQTVRLVISIEDEMAGLPERVRGFRALFPDSRIVVICGRGIVPARLPGFARDVDALLLKDISCEGLVGALQLAAAGEKVYPTAMLPRFSDQPDLAAVNSNQPSARASCRLSRQELNIVNCLASGQPNKVIAQYLDITEATVKVHVKTILRKMGATNRTQAAIFAISQGLAAAPDAGRGTQLYGTG